MDALSGIKVPDDPGPFKRAEDHWKPHVDDPTSASVFAGPNWAWPTLAAARTDPAERQASRLPAFHAADPAHVDLFAAANVRLREAAGGGLLTATGPVWWHLV
jgi:hypothetical protein